MFLFHPLLLCRRFAQNIESLLNARSWGSIEQNEQDDPLQREEIDNKQENEDNFKQWEVLWMSSSGSDGIGLYLIEIS